MSTHSRDGPPLYSVFPPPPNYVATLRSSSPHPQIPPKPSYGIDSPLGLVPSSFCVPLYLYATLNGNFAVWDDLVDAFPEASLRKPTLDIGCGRGLVLLKLAQRKKAIAASSPHNATVKPAYGVDIFVSGDQSGNSPKATYANAGALGVLDFAVLHTADFTAQLPFVDGVFAIVTASLSVHNAGAEGRRNGIQEIARVCEPGGNVVIVELYGYIREYMTMLREMGWADMKARMGGLRLMYGIWPCQILEATKPVH
jgi:SAM-dependent methyltransferase